MKIARIFAALLSKAEPIAERIRVAVGRAPPDSGGPQYDENDETLYPDGASVIFDADQTKKEPTK